MGKTWHISGRISVMASGATLMSLLLAGGVAAPSFAADVSNEVGSTDVASVDVGASSNVEVIHLTAPTGVVGAPYSYQLPDHDGSSSTITQGDLPPGVSDSSNVVEGIPTQAGQFLWTVEYGWLVAPRVWQLVRYEIVFPVRLPHDRVSTVVSGTLAGLWSSASTPRAFCPASFPYLTDTVYSLNPIRSWGGVQVSQSSSGLDAAIQPIWSNYPANATGTPTGKYATGIDMGSVTQWEAKSNTYTITLHCTEEPTAGYVL